MNWKKATKIVTFFGLPLIIVLIFVYDFVAIEMHGGNEASISSLLISQSYKFPMIPFCTGLFIGFICGHLFWRMRTNKDTEKIDKMK